jgi:hypothetical protein
VPVFLVHARVDGGRLMSASYVRDYYRVPAKQGMRVTVNGRDGVITDCPDQYIAVRFDGETESVRCHPTWRVDYHTTRTEAAPRD